MAHFVQRVGDKFCSCLCNRKGTKYNQPNCNKMWNVFEVGIGFSHSAEVWLTGGRGGNGGRGTGSGVAGLTTVDSGSSSSVGGVVEVVCCFRSEISFCSSVM